MEKNKNLAEGVYNIEYTPSEGELFVKYFLEEERFKFQQEKPIVNLLNDSKKYRRADFYLVNYGVYIEFLGRWNNTKKDREEYREKKKVFELNRVPCIYLYPENLGIIEFSFYNRLEKLLEEKKMKRQLLKLKWKFFIKDYDANFMILLLAFSGLILLLIIQEKEQLVVSLFLVLSLILLFQFVRLIRGFVNVFRK